MRKAILPYFTLIGVVLISTLLLWLPFLIRAPSWFGLEIKNSNFQYIYRNFDGPLYIVPAKTFYIPHLIENLGLEISYPVKYFAAHLPFYPMLISLFAPVMGFLKAMISVNILSTVFLTLFFYKILIKFKLTKKPLLLTTVFLFLPRFIITRSIGAPESLFILLILLSLYFFERALLAGRQENYLLSGIFGALATMTKTPGILLFVTYLLVYIERKNKLQLSNGRDKFVPLLKLLGGIILIPLGLLVVFLLYHFQYNDFFAYFHSGDNLHLVGPFSAFNFQKTWIGTVWLEDIIFYFFLYLFTVISLKNFKYRSFYYFALVFFIATIFVQHRDIARYSLPLWPLALIAFEKFFTSKKFLIAFLILLPAIYLFAWNFLLYNNMPISDWKPFL